MRKIEQIVEMKVHEVYGIKRSYRYILPHAFGRAVYKQTFQKLNEKIIDEILLSEIASLKFRFPKHLRDICKQYLSYFGKFLLDHNIDCELSLIDKDDITYMTINVDQSQIDIEKLKQALVGYFALPIAPQENINFDTYNIATQQLIANIEHLKSQLRLANATIAQYENNSLANYPKPVEYVLVDSLQVELPEGAKVLVTVLPSDEAEFWNHASQELLNKVWDNTEDDIYAELLEQ